MNDLGYLYVLANSSMPGLVKVGKTTRTPSERAGELAGVTGLPTPFIVVYEQLFQDCHTAESFVHTYLAQKGHRVADNREFFNAPVNIVIRAIGLAPGAIDDDRAPHELDKLDSQKNLESEPNYPWMDVFLEAMAYYNGNGDYLQDDIEAMRLFHQAATLGSISAYGYIGRMYQFGEGVPPDEAQALHYYKEGSRKGNVYCDWAMGILFKGQGKHANAEKCISKFIKDKSKLPPQSLGLLPGDLKTVFLDCVVSVSISSAFDNIKGMGDVRKHMSEEDQKIPSLQRFIAENAQKILDLNKLLREGNPSDEKLASGMRRLENLVRTSR